MWTTVVSQLCDPRIASKKDPNDLYPVFAVFSEQRVLSQMTNRLKIVSMILSKPTMLLYIIKEVLQIQFLPLQTMERNTFSGNLRRQKIFKTTVGRFRSEKLYMLLNIQIC